MPINTAQEAIDYVVNTYGLDPIVAEQSLLIGIAIEDADNVHSDGYEEVVTGLVRNYLLLDALRGRLTAPLTDAIQMLKDEQCTDKEIGNRLWQWVQSGRPEVGSDMWPVRVPVVDLTKCLQWLEDAVEDREADSAGCDVINLLRYLRDGDEYVAI